MSEHTDNQDLIISARSGDNSAVTELIRGLMPCVEATAHLYAHGPVPVTDLIQEGLIGAVNAIFSFDPSMDVRFGTYAQRCISNSIISALRKATGKKQSVLNNFVPLEDVEHLTGSETDNPEALITMNERIDSIYRFIDTRLTEIERDAILLRISGESIAQISSKLGVSEKSVSNALARARKKLHTAIN